MGHTPYCLMCLGTKVKMYPMNSMMIRMYNDIISTPHKRNLKRMNACYECAHLLHKYEKFKTKCCKAYNILCNLSSEPSKVSEKCLNSIDRKENKLVTNLNSCTLIYEYHPEQRECKSGGELNSTITFDNKLNNDENDPLQTHSQEVQTDVRSTLEQDIEDDYQFIRKFQVESSNYHSNTGSVLWLSIQSKDNTEVCKNKPPLRTPVQLDKECVNTVDDHVTFGNSLVQQKLEIHIQPETVNDKKKETNKKKELVNDIDDKHIAKKDTQKNKNRNDDRNDYSDTETDGCLLTLDSKILNDHMTVIDLTPEDAQHEFLLRKKSSNYTRNPFKCDLCYRGFISKTSYESHLKKHSLKNGAYQCDICKLCFIGKSYLNNHRIRAHRRKFSCKMCPYVCFAQTQCNAHILSHRGKVYTCKECGMTYRFRNSLLTHMHFKHSVECVCDFCGSTFASKYGLFSHKHIAHRQEKNEHLGPKCDECDVHFASELAWKRHRVLCSRHGVQFGCKVCGDVLEDSDGLKMHSREHGTMDYWTRKNYLVKTCKFCKIALPNTTELKNHIMTEHASVITDESMESKDLKPEEKYVCEICGAAFHRRSYLVLHQRRHSDAMPYSCPDCGMRTKYKDYLTVHRKTQHTDECTDKYLCDLCGRPFSDKGRLVRHMRAHMGIRPYKCVACDKTFLFRCDERTHYKHVHDKEPYPKKDKNTRSRRKAPRAKVKVFHNI